MITLNWIFKIVSPISTSFIWAPIYMALILLYFKYINNKEIYNMNTNEIITIISTLGFPIVMCLALAWYVKYQTDTNREEVKSMRKENQEEIAKVTEALNNNTIALQKLVDKLEG